MTLSLTLISAVGGESSAAPSSVTGIVYEDLMWQGIAVF